MGDEFWVLVSLKYAERRVVRCGRGCGCAVWFGDALLYLCS